MKKKNAYNFIKNTVNNQRGASLAIVMIIMVLFLTLGAAILAAASGAAGSSGQKSTSQQAVFAASSAMEVLWKSLYSKERDQLGKVIGNEVIQDVQNSIVNNTEMPESTNLTPEISFNHETVSAIKIKDVTIVYGKPRIIEEPMDEQLDGGIQDYTIFLDNVKITLTAEDQSTQPYTMEGIFNYKAKRRLIKDENQWTGAYSQWTKKYIRQAQN